MKHTQRSSLIWPIKLVIEESVRGGKICQTKLSAPLSAVTPQPTGISQEGRRRHRQRNRWARRHSQLPLRGGVQ